MKLAIATAAAAAALVLPAAAWPASVRWDYMTIAGKRQFLSGQIKRDHYAIRWWVRHRPTPATLIFDHRRFVLDAREGPIRVCPALGILAPSRTCGKARQMRHARSLLAELPFPLPPTGDWVVATALADRVFPGTQAWLLSCSSGEGGHGGWVNNYQGSDAGGWMQFMPGTFSSYQGAALAEVTRRGYSYPAEYVGYYAPLGQALVAAWMRTHGESHHWDSSIDYHCA